MAERHQMRALGSKGSDNAAQAGPADSPALADAGPLDLEYDWTEVDEADAPHATPKRGWIVPALAILALSGWTGFYGWAMQAEIFAAPVPGVWAQMVVQWSVPAGLIGIGWLLAMRNSRTEAARFGESAALLARESANLETRLKVVNRELSLAREFLAAQSRELESLGRIAAERIGGHAAELQALITANGAQVEAIGTTSDTALGNMNRLRDDLPVIANAARDVANQIGGAGRNAQDQLERLVSGFDRLNAFGAASETQVRSFGERIDASLTGFAEHLAGINALLTDRFAVLQRDVSASQAEIAAFEAEAMAVFERRIAALENDLSARIAAVGEVDRKALANAQARLASLVVEAVQFDENLMQRNRLFAEQIEKRQAAFDTHEAQASEVLSQRLAALDDALAQRREAQIAEAEKLTSQGVVIAEQLDQLRLLMEEITQQGDAARTSLGQGLDALGRQLADKRSTMQEAEAQLAELTESGIRLLEIIQSGARATREDLPAAIAAANTSLGQVEGRADKIHQLMLNSSEQGSDLSGYLLQTRNEVDAANTAIAGFRSNLAAQTEDALARLQGLRGGFARLTEESGALASDAQDRLQTALGTLEAAITGAFATLDTGTREKVAGLSQTIGSEAVEALERALRNETAATIGKLEQAAAHASGVGREATIQLRDQLVRVNELTGNLEQRVARARELAEEQVNNDFARRMALITDSLNSAAIDISGALSTEVTDSAWDAYLKGDRGIFTRRAVRLIDNGTARDIVALYSEDEGFKANVSRYIHDFEVMLRSMLSTRDGHVLSVTVLGSDMGKLYVALAQAIQRLRT
jgi:hypothetical protein